MSSSPQSSSSSVSIASNDSLGSPEITMTELALVLRDPRMRTAIIRDFDDDQIGQLVLRWIVSISNSLDHHRAEVQRLQTERQFAVDYRTSNQSFTRRVRGLVFIHRERQRAANPSPIQTPLPPLFDSSPSPSAYDEPLEMPESTTPPFLTTNVPPSFEYSSSTSPITVEIEDRENSPSEDSVVSFYTPNTHELGSQQNPINVDQLNIQSETPHPTINILRRTRSNPLDDRRVTLPANHSESSLPLSYCRNCGLHGHLPDGCLRQGPFICTYCREIGHKTTDCVERRRDEARYHPEMQFCLVCSQTGHLIDRCFTLLQQSQ